MDFFREIEALRKVEGKTKNFFKKMKFFCQLDGKDLSHRPQLDGIDLSHRVAKNLSKKCPLLDGKDLSCRVDKKVWVLAYPGDKLNFRSF